MSGYICDIHGSAGHTTDDCPERYVEDEDYLPTRKVVNLFMIIGEGLAMSSWTCIEAEAIYELMQQVGYAHAEGFMIAHADSDDDDDDDHAVVYGQTRDTHDLPVAWKYKDIG